MENKKHHSLPQIPARCLPSGQNEPPAKGVLTYDCVGDATKGTLSTPLSLCVRAGPDIIHREQPALLLSALEVRVKKCNHARGSGPLTKIHSLLMLSAASQLTGAPLLVISHKEALMIWPVSFG